MKKIVLLVTALFLGGAANAFANPREIRELRAEIAAIRAEMSQAQEKKAAKRAKRGEKLSLNFDFLTVFQGTHNESRNVANYRLDIEAEKQLGPNARAFATLRVGDGAGLDHFRNNWVSLNATAGGDNTVELKEVGYEHSLFNDLLTVTVGKLDPAATFDNNAVANCEASQFLNEGFVNNASIGFLEDNIGLKVALNPVSFVELSAGYFVTSTSYHQADRDLFGIAQINFMPFANGNYRFLVWGNTSDEGKYVNSGREGYGWAISADQQIFNNFTLFGRYGWAQPEFFEVESAITFGLGVNGALWGRDDDNAAIAVGRTWISEHIAANGDRAETTAELFYSVQLTNHLTLTPSLQYVKNPDIRGNGTRVDDMVVYGLRARVQF